MSKLTATGRCSWPSGIHNYANARCTRCGAAQPQPQPKIVSQPYYCPCGCAQEVPSEGTYASDECESSPEQWLPEANPDRAEIGRARSQSWAEYLDSCADGRHPEESCERGTVGCSVRHRSEESCETW